MKKRCVVKNSSPHGQYAEVEEWSTLAHLSSPKVVYIRGIYSYQ